MMHTTAESTCQKEADAIYLLNKSVRQRGDSGKLGLATFIAKADIPAHTTWPILANISRVE